MNNKWVVELLGIGITVVLVLLVMLPIHFNLGNMYPFYISNTALIVITVSFARYIFLVRHHWISLSKWIKLVLVFVPIPIFIFLMDTIYNFQTYLDDGVLSEQLLNLPFESQSKLFKYIKTEMIFFWASCFIANLIMPFRMIISIWREVNKGTH